MDEIYVREIFKNTVYKAELVSTHTRKNGSLCYLVYYNDIDDFAVIDEELKSTKDEFKKHEEANAIKVEIERLHKRLEEIKYGNKIQEDISVEFQ